MDISTAGTDLCFLSIGFDISLLFMNQSNNRIRSILIIFLLVHFIFWFISIIIIQSKQKVVKYLGAWLIGIFAFYISLYTPYSLYFK